MTFKEKLVKLRKLKGLTQDQFASAVGVSRQAVYKWESGQSYPEVPKLLEMKLLFGISIDDLLDDSYEVVLPEKKKKKRLSTAAKRQIEEAVRAEEGISEPVEEAPVAEEAPALVEEAVTEAPAVEEAPVTEQAPAVAEQTVAEAPVVEEPVVSAPVEEEAPVEAPVAEEKPVAEEAPKKKGFFARLFGGK